MSEETLWTRAYGDEYWADVMREAVIPFAGREGKSLSLLHEPLARYSMGSEVGYGVAEYLIRTR